MVILGVIPPDYPRDALLHPSTVLLEGLLVLPGKTNQSLPTGTYPRTHQPTPLFDLPVKSPKTPSFWGWGLPEIFQGHLIAFID